MDTAEQRGVVLRLFDGLAIRFRCPSATHKGLGRKYVDIDFMRLKKQSRDIKKLFTELGYAPREIFNALQGDKRLIFNDIVNERRIDVFLDVFEMCHRFELKDRLAVDKLTITLADLLATKLQVIEITEREYKDIISLLHDHEVSDSDAPETINGAYLAQVCADDWGIYKTFLVNLGNIQSALDQYTPETEYQDIVRNRTQDLQGRIENVPKTMRWRIRARVGEKVRWYELPEHDMEVVDSRVTTNSS